MLNSIKTLLDTVKSFDIRESDVVFLNAIYHPELDTFSDCNLILQQYFKPYEVELINAGFSVSHDIPNNMNSYDMVCILLPKNMIEARYLIARGIKMLRLGGVLVCAAGNKVGGSRIKKMLAQFGVDGLSDNSKNKSRCVSGLVAENVNYDMVEKSLYLGAEQEIMGGAFISRAGIFGWNKIDKGSAILTKYIPKDLKGRGADFGCGYGYLSSFLLSNCKKIKHLTCLDADYRAVEICRKNLSQFELNKELLWVDLTSIQDGLRNLNFIVMNPPFHEGKNVSISVGKRFIDSAQQSLRRGGRLFMVANNHLPYDRILEDKFFECKKLYEGNGFKVFVALK